MNKKYILLSVSIPLYTFSLHAMNYLKPYDILLWPYYTSDLLVNMYILSEFGVGTKTFASHGSVASPFALFECEQNTLAMLRGYDSGTPIGIKAMQVNASNNETIAAQTCPGIPQNVRGLLLFNGDLKLIWSGAFASRIFFHPDWSLGIYIPAMAMRLSHICYTDLTQDITDEDIRTKELLTDPGVLTSEVRRLGCLDLSPWHRVGLGDIVMQLEWYRDFPQEKPWLRNVRINFRVGVGLPTCKRTDPDKLFALPFGYDGAFFIPCGLGLDFTIGANLRAGIDVQLTHIFGNTRSRRILTNPSQTEPLFLTKLDVFKDFGLNQQFILYIESLDIPLPGLSCKLGYQYIKQGDDIISFNSNQYSPDIANLAPSLHDRTIHSIYIVSAYEIGQHFAEDMPTQIGIYARLPFNGKRVIVEQMVGLSFAINF